MSLVSDVEVGFDRTLRRAWMDQVAYLVGSGLAEADVRREMRAYLEPELPGVDARRKVVTLLLRIWIAPVGHVRTLRDAALELWPDVPYPQRAALHWGLSSAAYPFFHGFAQSVGRVARLQDRFAVAHIHQRMRERFGDRELVHRAGRHVLYTLADWGAIVPGGERGVYRAGTPLVLGRPELATWLVEAELTASRRAMLPFTSLVRSAAFFPFVLPDPAEILSAPNPRLDFSRQGLDEEMVALATVPG